MFELALEMWDNDTFYHLHCIYIVYQTHHVLMVEITNILCLNRFVVETVWHEQKRQNNMPHACTRYRSWWWTKKDKTICRTRILDTARGDEQKTKQYATRGYSILLVVMNKVAPLYDFIKTKIRNKRLGRSLMGLRTVVDVRNDLTTTYSLTNVIHIELTEINK